MHLSGQYLVQARQEEIEAELLRCEFMRKASPPCLAIEHIDDITRLVTVESAVDHSIKLQYLFRFNSKASEPNRLVIDWQGTDPRSATPKGHHDIQFEQPKEWYPRQARNRHLNDPQWKANRIQSGDIGPYRNKLFSNTHFSFQQQDKGQQDE